MNPVCTPHTQESPTYASLSEARSAIHALSGVELKKLEAIALVCCRAFRIPPGRMEPRELFHEAVERTLDGRKQWRRGVGILLHLGRAMENIAGHEVPKMQRRVEAGQVSDDENGESVDDPLDKLRDLRNHNRDMDLRAAAKEDVKAIYALFDDDPEAFAVFKHRADGHEKKDIQSLLKLSDTVYATLSKRILRKITSYHESRSIGR